MDDIVEKDMLISDHTDSPTKKPNHPNKAYSEAAFLTFQSDYLNVYYLIMFADWLQGTNMYALYQSYGLLHSQIGSLFLTGFISSAVFGTFTGSYIDKFGRKNASIFYCILEVIINSMEHSSSFPILIFGRVLGGLSTSILFSSFESWMVTQHRKLGFPEDLLTSTFSKGSIANGLLAIAAGLISHGCTAVNGLIGPFQLAIFITIVAMLKIQGWEENYGDDVVSSSTDITTSRWKITGFSKNIWLLASGTAFFEGAMFVFVFMWVPTMQKLTVDGEVATGLLFSVMMLCSTLGGWLFDKSQTYHKAPESIAIMTVLLAIVSLAVPAMMTGSFYSIFIAFMVFETTVGLYSPCAASLRSKFIESKDMGTVLTLARVPLNMIVAFGTKFSESASRHQVFFFCCTCLCFSAASHYDIMKTKRVVNVNTIKSEEMECEK